LIQYEYINLKDVLYQIGNQAKKDVDFFQKKLPQYITTPQELFLYLSTLTSFKDDPPNVELIQGPKNLFQKNYWGVPGQGDCDCLTTLSICCFLATQILPVSSIEIVLAGRNKKDAVHIYLSVKDQNGLWYAFDLTEPNFGIKRKYPYLQKIPLKKIL